MTRYCADLRDDAFLAVWRFFAQSGWGDSGDRPWAAADRSEKRGRLRVYKHVMVDLPAYLH
jgi:hypothetical protein